MALNGGVSLAVWMAGCAVELDCARRAHLGPELLEPRPGATEPPPERTVYHALCKAFHRELVIDLMTGSSAGGINGALLAAAVHKQRRLHPDYIRDKWLELGSFQLLMHELRVVAPTSLMNGTMFHRRLKETFAEILPPRSSDKGPTTALAEERLRLPENQRAAIQEHSRVLIDHVKLLVTATDVLGRELRFRDSWGEELVAHEYRHRFEFRQPADFRPDRLADAARASASFPLAFEPWAVDGEALQLDGTRWLIDGGLLDNAPIRAVLDLIPARASDRRVRRFVCYVNADPPLTQSFNVEADAAATVNEVGLDRRPTEPQLQDVLGYMVNLPRKATFVDHLRAIQRAARRAVAVEKGHQALLALDHDALRITANALLPAYRSRRRVLSLEEQLEHPAEISVAAERLRRCNGELPWIPTSIDPPRDPMAWGWGVRAAERILHLLLDCIRHALERMDDAGGPEEERQALFAARKTIYDRATDLEQIRELTTNDPHIGRLIRCLVDEDAPEVALGCLKGRMEDRRRDPRIHSVVRSAAAEAYRVRASLGSLDVPGQHDLSVATALFGDATAPDELDDTGFARFLERTLWIEVVRRSFSSDDDVDTDQYLSFAQITPCAPTLLLTPNPLQEGAKVPDRPDLKLTGTAWGHFAGFYRPSWRANDFMWGRLDGAVRVVDMLVDVQRAAWAAQHLEARPEHVLVEALAPAEAARDGRRWLIAEALVDAEEAPERERYREAEWRGSKVKSLEAMPDDEFRQLLADRIAADLQPSTDPDAAAGHLTRALCIRAAQWEILRHELPIVVELSQADTAMGTATAPLPPLPPGGREAIEHLREASPLPKRLGRDEPAERGSALMIRTATHGAMVGLSALRATRIPLARVAYLPRALLLPIAGLVAQSWFYAGAVALAYWAFSLIVTGRIVTMGSTPGDPHALAVVVTWVALLGVFLVCLLPLWRLTRLPRPTAKLKQAAWLAALVAAGGGVAIALAFANGMSVGDIAAQDDAERPWGFAMLLVLGLSLGLLVFLPRFTRRSVDNELFVAWRGRRSLITALLPWILLGAWAIVPVLDAALTAEQSWRTTAAWIALLGPPAVALAYVAVSNRGKRLRTPESLVPVIASDGRIRSAELQRQNRS